MNNIKITFCVFLFCSMVLARPWFVYIVLDYLNGFYNSTIDIIFLGYTILQIPLVYGQISMG